MNHNANKCILLKFGTLLIIVLTIIVYVSQVESESMLVSQTVPAPLQNETEIASSPQTLEEKIDNLTFNLRHIEEVLIQWKKNFKMIDRRFNELEKKVQDSNSNRPEPSKPVKP